MRQLAAQKPVGVDPLPWREEAARNAPPPPPEVETDIYAEARRTLGLNPEQVCARCGGRIGASRVTDGVQAWHPECR